MIFEEAYQAQILNQNVSMFILKEQYESITNKILYENNLQILREEEESRLKKAGAWIKDKVQKFIKMIKEWLGKLKNFLFKTIPEFLKKKWDGLLIFLKIKKKPVVIDATDAKDKDKLEQAANAVNRSANAQAMAQLANDTKLYGATAAKLKADSIKLIRKYLQDAHEPDLREYYYPMIKAIQNNQCVYLKLAKGTDHTVKGTIFDRELGYNALIALDNVLDIDDLINGLKVLANNINTITDDKAEQIPKMFKNINTAEDIFKETKVPTMDELKNSRKEIEANFDNVTEYLSIKTQVESLAKYSQKQFNSLEKVSNDTLAQMQKAVDSPDVSNQKAITVVMQCIRTVVNLFSSCCVKVNQYQNFMCQDIANFIKVCKPDIHE